MMQRPRRNIRGVRKTTSTSRRGWDEVADWYDRLVGEKGSDYHQQVVLPAALRLLDPHPGERFIDLCCGQGVLARLLAEKGAASVLGVDVSPRMIAAAKGRGNARERVNYQVADASKTLGRMEPAYDGAACVMAVQDVENVEGLFAEMARALRTGGRAVVVMMHPCFRVPRQSSWGWDEEKQTRYRRLDRYATPMTIPISTRPGADPEARTLYYHRPLADYLNGMRGAGLSLVAMEELLSHRRIEPGGRSRGENRAADEFPLFLALKAIKMG